MNIVFRVDCNSFIGLGNFNRCLAIAEKLYNKKNRIFFVMNENPKVAINYEKKYEFIYLNNKIFDEVRDADKLLKHFLFLKIDFIFLDQIKLNKLWKSIIKFKCKNIISFNDLLVEDKISKFQICYNLRAEKQKNDKKLFGPEFFVTKNKKKQSMRKKVDLIFYYGGSGDFSFFRKITKNLLKSNLKIRFIIGPLSKNYNWIIKLSKLNKLISYIKNPKNIIYEFSLGYLVVASAGTSIYELNLSKTPAILFRTSYEQINLTSDLEKLGHFFYFSKEDLLDHKKFSTFIIKLIKNHYNELIKIIQNRKININFLGAKKIIDRIFNKKTDIIFNKKKIKIIDNKKSFRISRIKFNQINQAFDLINKKNNRSVSVSKKINYLDHCIWWLTNKRETYCLTDNNKKIQLIFYHEIIEINKSKYIIAGWYSEKNLNFLQILRCLIIQYKKIPNGFRWLSIINKKNRVSKKINDYFKFTNVDVHSKEYYAIKKIYKNNNNFNYYYLDK